MARKQSWQRIRAGITVRILDHEEVPYEVIGRLAEVDRSLDGYVDLVVRDSDGRVMPFMTGHQRGVLCLPIEAVRVLTPLEQLAHQAKGGGAP